MEGGGGDGGGGGGGGAGDGETGGGGGGRRGRGPRIGGSATAERAVAPFLDQRLNRIVRGVEKVVAEPVNVATTTVTGLATARPRKITPTNVVPLMVAAPRVRPSLCARDKAALSHLPPPLPAVLVLSLYHPHTRTHARAARMNARAARRSPPGA